jgi:hypothetical protein
MHSSQRQLPYSHFLILRAHLNCGSGCFSKCFLFKNASKQYFFYFLKFIFDINTSKRSKITNKKKYEFDANKKIKNFQFFSKTLLKCKNKHGLHF